MIENTIEAGIELAKEGKIPELTQWLDSGNSPNRHDQNGWTPLLWAAVRGNHEVVQLLVDKGADLELAHKLSDALAIHLAGHSGSVKSADIILEKKPDQIDAVLDLNGHTILLQASFYGHLELAKYLVKKGADTSITTARGLGAMEMAEQFQNHVMMDVIAPYDRSDDDKAAYYKKYLQRIAPVIQKEDIAIQKLSDDLVFTIEDGIKRAFVDSESVSKTLEKIKELVDIKGADVNRLGGTLQQPPLIVSVTGNNGLPNNDVVSNLRKKIAEYLLEKGADPTKHENHPMGVQTIIRAAVFNHLDILKMCAAYMSPQSLADAINEYPIVNGLTALHDTVLRATMAGEDKFPGYLEQVKFFMENGGKSDMEDFTGRTQRDYAEKCLNKSISKQLIEILDFNKN